MDAATTTVEVEALEAFQRYAALNKLCRASQRPDGAGGQPERDLDTISDDEGDRGRGGTADDTADGCSTEDGRAPRLRLSPAAVLMSMGAPAHGVVSAYRFIIGDSDIAKEVRRHRQGLSETRGNNVTQLLDQLAAIAAAEDFFPGRQGLRHG